MRRQGNPPSLEVEYLKALRVYDSNRIALEFDQRDVKRRRQAIEDRERRIRQRQRRIEKVKANAAECDTTGMHEAERRVVILKMQLDSTIKQLRHIKRGDKEILYGLDSENPELTSLRIRERQLKSKMTDLEARQAHARKTLSEPVDDPRMIEVTIEILEDDIALAETQLHSKSDATEPENFENLSKNLDSLEEASRQRKIELMRRQAEITAAKQVRENSPMSSPRLPLSPRSRMQALNVEEIVNGKKIGNSLDRMFQSFDERQNKINRDEHDTDDLEKSYQNTRRETEEEWNSKLKRVRELTEAIRENENMKLEIAESSESLENERHQLNVLVGEKEKIQRRISNILRDKDYNSQKTSEHQKLVESLEERKRQLEEHDKTLQAKKEELEMEERKADELEEEVNSLAEQVEALDHQARNLETQNDKRIAEIQETSAEFEALRLTIPTEEANNQVFDEEFLKSLGKEIV